MGEFQRYIAGLWWIVYPSAAILAIPLTVAFLRLKKPCIHAGFNNLNTEGNEGNEEAEIKKAMQEHK